MKRFLTEHEVAAMIRVRVTTVRRWRMCDKGPAYRKLGGAVRYEVAHVERWIEGAPQGGGRYTTQVVV